MINDLLESPKHIDLEKRLLLLNENTGFEEVSFVLSHFKAEDLTPKQKNSLFKNMFSYPCVGLVKSQEQLMDLSKSLRMLVEDYNFDMSDKDFSCAIYVLSKVDPGIFDFAKKHNIDRKRMGGVIRFLSKDKENGINELKMLHKENIFDFVSADGVYELLASKPNSKVIKWLYSKEFKSCFSEYTKEGSPAWWGFSNEKALNIVFSRIDDLTQKSLSGNSYIFNLIKKSVKYDIFNTENMTIFSFFSQEMRDRKQKFDVFNERDENQNNLIHLMMMSYSAFTTSFLKLFEDLVCDNYHQLINVVGSEKNKTPLKLMFDTWDGKDQTFIMGNRFYSCERFLYVLLKCKNEIVYNEIINKATMYDKSIKFLDDVIKLKSLNLLVQDEEIILNLKKEIESINNYQKITGDYKKLNSIPVVENGLLITKNKI
jgi:hypothetical protein